METYSLYDGEVLLDFNPDTHVYYLDGKKVPNITSIIGIVAKPALVAWKIKTVVNYIREHFFGVIDDELVAEAKNEPLRIVTQAGDVGTEVHRIIEEYINHCLEDGDPDVFEPQYQIRDDDPDFAITQRRGWLFFREWLEDNEVEWLMSEQKLYSREHNYCGTMDALCILNGMMTALDFKTSNRLYKSYLVQVAGYVGALQEQYDTVVEQIYILRIPKEDLDFRGDPAACEVMKLTGKKIQEAILDFIACLRLYMSPRFK